MKDIAGGGSISDDVKKFAFQRQQREVAAAMATKGRVSAAQVRGTLTRNVTARSADSFVLQDYQQTTRLVHFCTLSVMEIATKHHRSHSLSTRSWKGGCSADLTVTIFSRAFCEHMLILCSVEDIGSVHLVRAVPFENYAGEQTQLSPKCF